MFKKAISTQPGVYKSFIIGSKNQGRKCHENILKKKILSVLLVGQYYLQWQNYTYNRSIYRDLFIKIPHLINAILQERQKTILGSIHKAYGKAKTWKIHTPIEIIKGLMKCVFRSWNPWTPYKTTPWAEYRTTMCL